MKYLNVFVICVGLAIAGPVHNPRQYASANKIDSICKERGFDGWDCDFNKRDCEKKGKVDEELLTCLNVIGKKCNADSECGDGYICLGRPITFVGAGSTCQPTKEEKVTTDTQEKILAADVKKICEFRGWSTAATEIHPTPICDLKKKDCEEEGKKDAELLTCLNVISKKCKVDSDCGDGYICVPLPILMIGAGSTCQPTKEEKVTTDTENTQGQLSLDGSSPSLTFKYATSQSSSDNWIGVWPEDDAQAPTWGSAAWDYAKESSGSLHITPPSSMKAGGYKAYLLSNDRTILAFLSSFDYSPASSSVAFSVKTHYNTNCAGSVNNNVDIKPGNGVCVNTNCGVGSLEIPSVGSCPNGQVRISYWQNADCAGDWYGYGYGSRGTCRGLWSDGWGFQSMWLSCAEPSSDCIQQGTCTADPEPSVGICRNAFHLKTRYSARCTGDVHNEVTVPHGNGQCIDTDCAVGSLDIDSAGSCPDGELRISYWDQPGCSGKWFGYDYGSRNTCRSLWSSGWSFKSLWVSCAKQSDDCVSQGTCTIDVPSRSVC